MGASVGQGALRASRLTRRAPGAAPPTPVCSFGICSSEELGERRHLQQHRPPLRRRVAEDLEALARQLPHLLVLGDVHPHRLRRAQVDADAVHPLAGDARALHHMDRLQDLHRAGDRAAAGEQGFGQLADGLIRRIADGEIADQAAHHRREGVAAGVEPAHVVGEGDLSVGRHDDMIHTYLRSHKSV